GADQPVPIASVAKAVTALAVLQKMPLAPGDQGPLFTVTAADVALYENYVAKNGSVVRVALGDQLTQRQMLEAMLLPSGNNIADSLAIWAFGSLENYRTYANAMVAEIGMTHTIIGSDASGYAPDTTSTPSDLVLLAHAAITQPTIASIVGQSSAVLPTIGTITNTNSLLDSHGVIGIKTGTSAQAGACLLFAATYVVHEGQTITLVGTVLGATNRSDALAKSASLIDSAAHGFSYETPIHKGDAIATYQLPWGGEVVAVAKDDISFTRWQSDTVQIRVAPATLNQSVQKDAQLGTLTVTAGDKTFTVPLVAAAEVADPSLLWRLLRH
ncbi:MAG TPA: serine hydrolase, partial [Magnetospirillaceae bacterium]|nr:serine hydrolase [Magnetospirillaceae bacterium]